MAQKDDNGSDSDHRQIAEAASAYYASIGPWVTAAAVMKSCNLSEQTLESWRESRLVLGVEFADGQFYYPRQQFADGHPLPGLRQVLDALAPAFRTPASQAGWLAREAYRSDPTTRWAVLRAGEVQLVVGWAEEDTARVTRP